MRAEKKLQLFAWSGALLLVAVAVLRWAQVRLGDGEVGPYELFPLLGLIAWSLMWTHYTVGPVQRWLKAKDGSLKTFFSITGWIVLAFILLHPTIFVFTLYEDGLGIPPASYVAVYPAALELFAIALGYLALCAFLAYEFHRRYKDRKWWRFVEYANVAAMFAIFYHALTLGGEISGWFLIVWIVYGITLAAAIAYNYYYKKQEKSRA